MAKPRSIEPSQYAEIRGLFNAGHRQTDIAKMFGCSRSLISDICCFRTESDDPDTASKLQQLTDGKNWARARLRVNLRNEDVIRHCGNIAAEAISPLRPVAPPKFKKRRDAKQETAVLILSDGHHDQVVRAEEVGGLEEYNFKVSCRRAEVLCDSIIKFAKQTLVGYDFHRLVILSLGDNTSGEIHDAERRSAFGIQFKNCLAIGGLHASLYRDLAAHFPRVEILGLSGNHGRRTNTKEYAGGPHNNWDYMVNKVAQAYLSDVPNISFNIPNSWNYVVDLEGFGFHCSHGDDVSASGGNPWNGLQSRHKTQSGIHRGAGKNKSFRGGNEIDYYAIGHYHTRGIVSGNGVGYLCNGAWLGTDQYAYHKLGVAGPPEQLLFGVNKDRGITWQLPLQLEGRDGNKTCRYDRVLDTIEGVDASLAHPRLREE